MLIAIKGAGDLATGIACRLHRCGFQIVCTDIEKPTTVRCTVAFSRVVYDGAATVTGVTARLAKDAADARRIIGEGEIPILIDPEYKEAKKLEPAVLVDAIIAKKNLGTTRDMAPLTIALGPGFVAGQDVDVVVETKRGHKLGRIIRAGSAAPNSGVPGVIGGYGAERVIHSPAAGVFRNRRAIADFVEAGETIALLETPEGETVPVTTQISGILRGLLRDGYPVPKGFKVADVDPRREELENCFLISDKARCIAGSVLELVAAELWK